MGKMQKRKGSRVEREIVNILKTAGIEAKRVPLSGSTDGFKGDILINGKIKCEVKARKNGFKTIYSSMPALEDGILKLSTDKNRYVVMHINKFINFLRTKAADRFCTYSIHKKLKQIDDWMQDDIKVLFIKANRKPVLAIIRIKDYLTEEVWN